MGIGSCEYIRRLQSVGRGGGRGMRSLIRGKETKRVGKKKNEVEEEGKGRNEETGD